MTFANPGGLTPYSATSVAGAVTGGAFVLAAVLTPPDVISQLSLAIPLMLLYEGAIWSSKLVEPKAPPVTAPATDVAE